MIRCSLESLVASCVKPIREDGCGGVWIEPSNYTCLRKISIRDFRALLEPYKVEVHYVENPIVNGFNWYVTRENFDDPAGWLCSERKDI